MQKKQVITAGRYFAYIALAAVCAGWWFDNFSVHHINWLMTVLFAVCIVAMLARKHWVDKYLGYYLALGSCYMLLAVGSAAIRNSGPGHTGNPTHIIIFGGLLFLLTLASSIALVLFAGITRAEQSGKKKQALNISEPV